LKVGSWKLEVESWKLEVGSWKLEVGSWKLEVGSWKLEVEEHSTSTFNTQRSTFNVQRSTIVCVLMLFALKQVNAKTTTRSADGFDRVLAAVGRFLTQRRKGAKPQSNDQ
jgi:hypothetical protein